MTRGVGLGLAGLCLLAVTVTVLPRVSSLPTHAAHQHVSLDPEDLEAEPIGEGPGLARPGGRAVAHYAGGRRAPARLQRDVPASQISYTGTLALEPTLGIDDAGAIFYVGADYSWIPAEDSNPRLGVANPQVVVSRNAGRSWKNVNPPAHPVSLDPFLHVDTDTGRVFSADIQVVGCTSVSFSDDRGDTWTTSKACGLTDHQNLFTGPPPAGAPPTVGYPNIAYYCAIDGGVMTASMATGCLKSRDGGLTWVRTGDLPFWRNEDAQRGDFGFPGHCFGGVGHGVAGRDGTVYLPRGWCDQPWLAISRDEGLTWQRVQVADTGIPFSTTAQIHEHEAAVDVDRAGNVYYAWVGADRLPYLAVSRDGGTSWSKPRMIGRPGLREAWGPKIVVGARGRVAVSYIGSTNAPGGKAPDGEGPEYTDDVTWNGYLTVTRNALARRPLYYTASVNHPSDPLSRGECGIPACGPQVDFIGLALAPNGTPWTSMADGCPPPGRRCADHGLGIVGQMKGARLW